MTGGSRWMTRFPQRPCAAAQLHAAPGQMTTPMMTARRPAAGGSSGRAGCRPRRHYSLGPPADGRRPFSAPHGPRQRRGAGGRGGRARRRLLGAVRHLLSLHAGADGSSRPPGGAAYPTCPISSPRGRRPADADRRPVLDVGQHSRCHYPREARINAERGSDK